MRPSAQLICYPHPMTVEKTPIQFPADPGSEVDCPTCRRAFIVLPNQCPSHCRPYCCKHSRPRCTFISPRPRPPQPHRCVVCGTPGQLFERFASDAFPWTLDCGISINDPSVFTHPASGVAYLRGSKKPRFHRSYCSIRCYCNPSSGHYVRASGGKKIRNHRYRISHGKLGIEERRAKSRSKIETEERENYLRKVLAARDLLPHPLLTDPDPQLTVKKPKIR